MIMLLCMPSELLDIYMSKLEEQLDRSEDSFRNMSSLLLLLQHFPGDMEPVFQQDVVTFFSNQLPVINQLRFVSLSVSDDMIHGAGPQITSRRTLAGLLILKIMQCNATRCSATR